MLHLKRIYEAYSRSDGYRILVDRLWPRGISKESAHLDRWLKDIGPSNTLRKWFSHDLARWEGFREKYRAELAQKALLLTQIRELEKTHLNITLLYGSRDEIHNQAVVLKDILSKAV